LFPDQNLMGPSLKKSYTLQQIVEDCEFK